MKTIGKVVRLAVVLFSWSATLAALAAPELLWERQGELFGTDAGSLRSEPLALFYQASDDTLLVVHQDEIELISAADGSTLSYFDTPTLTSWLVENFPSVYTNAATGVIEYLYSGGVMIDVVNRKLLWNDTRLPVHSQNFLLGFDTAFFSQDGRTVYAYGRESFAKPQQSLYAVNSADGSIAWQHVNATFSNPILHEESIYAGDVGTDFTAGLFEVDIATGEATQVWQSTVEPLFLFTGAWSSPAIAGNRLLLLDSDHDLLFFDLDSLGNGPVLSSADVGSYGPFLFAGTLQTNGATAFGFAETGPLVLAISVEDGSLLWTALDGTRTRLDENGEETTDDPVNIQLGPVTGNVYVIRESGVFVLDSATGAILAEIETGPENIYFPNTLIFNKDETIMYFLEDGGETSVWAYSLTNVSSSPAAAPTATAAPPSTSAQRPPVAAPVDPSPPPPGTTSGASGKGGFCTGYEATVLLVLCGILTSGSVGYLR